MINVGIIGFGKMGRIRAQVVDEDGRGVVAAVYDPCESTDVGRRPRAASAEEILADDGLDAVFICTPNFENRPLTIRGLKAGKHVFCEKPPAFTAKEVGEVREVEADTGMKLMYGFNHRHHDSVVHMRDLIDSGDYGTVLWMRGRYGKSVDARFFNDWRAKKALAGGGILLDQGIHMLDLFLYLGGGFDEVQSVVSSLYWNLEIEDNVFAILKNSQTGVVASLHSTMTQWRHLFSLEVFLQKGYMVLNGLKTSSGTYGDEVLSVAQNRTTAPAATWGDEERITYHTNTSWGSEVSHFFTAILEDQPIQVGSSANALELMTIVDQVYANGQGGG